MGFGGNLSDGTPLLQKLDGLHAELGFAAYTSGSKALIDVFCITAALMIGTAGLPHVIVRFFTVPRVKDARISAGYALIFIAILYTTAPAIAAFARVNLINTVSQQEYKQMPEWFIKWENSGLIAWADKNGDGKIQYVKGDVFAKKGDKPSFDKGADGQRKRGENGELLMVNALNAESANELFIDQDIMVLANPEIAQLPNWVIALVAAGGLAAALSTAAGLLLVISTSISHDLIKKQLNPNISERGELIWARIAAAVAVTIAGLFGIYPPGFVAQVVAFAFGLAAASFFPAIILGIFNKRMNREGAVAGMITGLAFTFLYIVYFKFGDYLFGVDKQYLTSDYFLFGISPEGIGTVGMLLNFVVSLVVSNMTPPPPAEVQEMVETIRYPRGAGEAVAH